MGSSACDVLAIIPWMAAGGGERHFQTLATGLEERGYRVRAFVLYRDEGHFSRVFSRWLIEEPLGDRYSDVAQHIAEYIDCARPRAVLFHGSDIGAYAVNAASHRPGSVVMVKHTMWDPDARLCALDHVQRAVDRYVCVSPRSAHHLSAFGVPGDKITVIRNGIDTAPMTMAKSVRSELGIPPDAFVVAHIGRICDEKGGLIAAGAVITEGVWGIFVGWGDQLSDLMTMKEKTGSGHRIHVLAATTDVWNFYASADMMLLPTKAEGAVPYAMMEAALMGCIPACTNVGDIGDLFVDGESFIEIERTLSSCRHAIQRVRRMTPEERNELAERAKKLTETIADRDRMITQYEEVLGLCQLY